MKHKALRAARHAEEQRGSGDLWRRLAVAGLSCALAFTIAPMSAAIAEEPVSSLQGGGSADASGQQNPQGADGASNAPPAGDAPLANDAPQAAPPGAAPFDIGDPDPALPDLDLKVSIAADGTGDGADGAWTGENNQDDLAGNDSGPNNGIVRVNDTVTYNVEYAVPNGTANNVTFSLKFPKGMEIVELPGYCSEGGAPRPGSAITPATAGEPALPLSATSIDELAEQTITCNRGTITSGTDIVPVTVRVLNLAHQGQALPLLSAEITADGFNGAVAPTLPSVTASSRLMWDISKNGVALEENSGYVSGPADLACPWDSALVCKVTYYSLLFSAPAGGKGAMPAVGDVTFVDDLSPEAMYPSLTPAQHTAMNADLNKYGSRIVFANLDTNYNRPGHKIGSTLVNPLNATNSVRDSGTITIDQPGPGESAEFTIAGADWSLRTYPTQVSYPVGNALPGNAAYAVSSAFRVYTPVATIRDFGVESSNSWTLSTYNSFTDLDIRGFDQATDVQGSDDQPGADAVHLPTGVPVPVHWNDYRTTTPLIRLPGSFDKFFMGMPGLEGNIHPTLFAPGNAALGEGPPGGATRLSGGITVAPTQMITSQLYVSGSTPSLPADVSWVGCDSWDNTKLNLATGDFGPGLFGGVMQRVPSNGDGVWVSGYNNVPEPKYYATQKSEVPELTVQYSAAPGGAGAASLCGNDMGPWYSDPSQVPGNDPGLAAEGIYTAVSRVRVHAVIPPAVEANSATGFGVRVSVSIALRVANNGMATGTILPNWGTEKRVNFEDLSLEEVLSAPGAPRQSTYNPEDHSGSSGDRLILAHAQARIDKQVRKGDSGSFSDTPPQTTGGDLVQYRLQPSLTSGAATPGILKDVWVEDCLPGSQIYASASLTPVLVQQTTPGDAKRPACAAGETYIRWVLPKHEVNKPIEPIIMSVTVDPTAEDGVYTNTVVVWAEDDASTLAQRSNEAAIQISNVRGIRIVKQPLTPVVQVNRADSQADQRELNEWSVRFSNRLPGDAPVPNNPDVIDVLPRQGLHGSAFNGTFTFDSVEVTEGDIAGQNVRVLYTKAASPSDDPRVASNGATGATTWCDATTGGAVVSGSGTTADCPASAAEVTAVRVQRPGPFSTGSAITFTIRMVGVDNRGGDVYVNRATGFATGLDNAVRTPESPEVAIESSIGDYTWWDFNRNGVQDSFKGSPEQPTQGVTVRIAGTDDLGNAIALQTTTDGSGKYLFPQLRTSDADGYTVTFVKPDGSEITVKAAGTDRAVDSNADPVTGVADPVVLGRNTQDLTIDAGFMPFGGMQINKAFGGAGAGDFAIGDTLVFDVVCVFDSELDGVDPVEVLNEHVTLVVQGTDATTSDVLGPLPAFTKCTVTETDSGAADGAAAPVEVTVPWDATAQTAGTPVASMTNFYSAGTVTLTKELAGDAKAIEWAKNKVFEFAITCQIEEPSEDGTVRATVYSGNVKIKGGQKKMLVSDTGDPRTLPLGARCFGEEINDGGASSSKIDAASFETGVAVTQGTPDELQRMTINAVNTFNCTDAICGKLQITGAGQLALIAAGGLGALLLLLGGALLMKRRREDQVA
ncbi:MAG: DUF5979 domain-containing protein [Actinobacteria bacterium]|nr:DUF5979 domain-containing protein [Actinomycetota bacterium]